MKKFFDAMDRIAEWKHWGSVGEMLLSFIIPSAVALVTAIITVLLATK